LVRWKPNTSHKQSPLAIAPSPDTEDMILHRGTFSENPEDASDIQVGNLSALAPR
jgi:hypothetical protein